MDFCELFKNDDCSNNHSPTFVNCISEMLTKYNNSFNITLEIQWQLCLLFIYSLFHFFFFEISIAFQFISQEKLSCAFYISFWAVNFSSHSLITFTVSFQTRNSLLSIYCVVVRNAKWYYLLQTIFAKEKKKIHCNLPKWVEFITFSRFWMAKWVFGLRKIARSLLMSFGAS